MLKVYVKKAGRLGGDYWVFKGRLQGGHIPTILGGVAAATLLGEGDHDVLAQFDDDRDGRPGYLRRYLVRVTAPPPPTATVEVEEL